MFPFAAYAPAAIVGDLKPSIAFPPVIQNMEGDCRLFTLTRGLDSDLNPFRLLLLGHRKRVGVNENLGCTWTYPSPENESQDHRQELRIEVLGIVNRGINLGFFYDNRRKGPWCMSQKH
jgi:hypothetical protein